MTDDAGADQRPTRIEHDALGDVAVPVDALWQAQTQRAVENFPVSGLTVDRSLLAALAAIKAEAARVNADLGVIPAEVADAVIAAADDVAAGAWADQFPVDVFQTGSGTSTNMNMNEVVATLASRGLGRRVHPNDEVNASQSSNDAFPTAIRIAAAAGVVDRLIPALGHLAAALRRKEDEFADVVKAGRTHLMDAVPVTLGQEFGGYATAVELGADRLRDTLGRLGALPLGGTAVGTGINAPPGFAARVVARLAERTGLPLREAEDHFEAQGGQDALVETSGACRVVATSLHKVAADLRWMSSGPAAGLAEIRLPDLQPGSSIMPGKVNPVLPEAVQQVVAQVIGNDAAVAFGATTGAFELNVMLPVMGHNLLSSIGLLARVSVLLADRCLDGIEADEERCLRLAGSSAAIVTAIVPLVGYEAAAIAAKRAVAEGRTVREVVLEMGLVDDEAALDDALDLRAMARGGRRTDTAR